jgi:hypothetical protein
MLEQQPFVHSSAQVGNVLRVMVASDLESPEKAIAEAITSQGLHLDDSRVAKPALEDVFVAATRAKKEMA